jgi:uracil-DNA glycosylase family 4
MTPKDNARLSELAELTKKAIQQKIEMGDTEIMADSRNFEDLPDRPKYKDLETFENAINTCTKCALHKSRTKFVFGVGNPDADIIFIGEGPGREEDLKGEPFVGRAGKLLDKILASIKFQRSEVYIANMVKCRPPNNRDPEQIEMDTCRPYLMEQIRMIKPKFICCLGRISGQALLESKLPLSKLRGYFHDWHGIEVMVTYHPAALLRFPAYKHETWKDVQMLRAAYDEYKASV